MEMAEAERIPDGAEVDSACFDIAQKIMFALIARGILWPQDASTLVLARRVRIPGWISWGSQSTNRPHTF
jgi:hypothetical protein